MNLFFKIFFYFIFIGLIPAVIMAFGTPMALNSLIDFFGFVLLFYLYTILFIFVIVILLYLILYLMGYINFYTIVISGGGLGFLAYIFLSNTNNYYSEWKSILLYIFIGFFSAFVFWLIAVKNNN